MLEKGFYKIGYAIASRPIISILICWTLAGAMVFGFFMIVTKTDPVDIWVDPTSNFVAQENYFNTNFGPFYRIEQYLFTPRDVPGADILQGKYLAEIYNLEQQVRAITITIGNTVYGLTDLCSHVYPGSNCIIQTILDYFQGYNASALAQLDSATIHQIVSRGGKSAYGAPLGKIPYPDICIGGIQR